MNGECGDMGKVKINISGKENLLWPSFCVLCLKPEVLEDTDSGYPSGIHVFYCQDCFDKVERLRMWEANSGFVPALLVGIVFAILYLIYTVRQGSWLELLRKGQWYMSICVGVIPFFIVLIATLLFIPLLPLIFPRKVANPGVITKRKQRKKTTQLAPGVQKTTSDYVIEALIFSNPEYAAMFRKANGLS